MPRKTIKRDIILEKLNKCLKSAEMSDEEKLAISTFAESILIAGNSYKGYTIPEPGASVSQRIYV
jgi:hypothetical protein